MRHRWWVVALGLAGLGLAQPSQGADFKKMFHIGNKGQDKTNFCIKQKAWLAYFRDCEGRVSPVRDTMSNDHDKDWLGLRFTEYDGPRIRLGVLKVINKSAEAEEGHSAGKIEVPVSGIQEMLTVALYNTKRFDVIEQKRAQEVKSQQTRTDVVEPSPSTIREVGKLLGAQYLVYGTVNEWDADRAQNQLDNKKYLKFGKQETEVAITFSLTDVASGQILFTTAERARLGEWNVGLQTSAGNGTTTKKTPTNYVLNICINKAAFKIARFLRDRKWIGTIVDVKGPKIYVNAGSQQGMKPDLLLSVFNVQGIVKDVEGRMVLGEDLQGIGTLSVDTVQPGFSIAHVVKVRQAVQKKDRVELASPPAPSPVPPDCEKMDQSRDP